MDNIVLAYIHVYACTVLIFAHKLLYIKNIHALSDDGTSLVSMAHMS